MVACTTDFPIPHSSLLSWISKWCSCRLGAAAPQFQLPLAPDLPRNAPPRHHSLEFRSQFLAVLCQNHQLKRASFICGCDMRWCNLHCQVLRVLDVVETHAVFRGHSTFSRPMRV